MDIKNFIRTVLFQEVAAAKRETIQDLNHMVQHAGADGTYDYDYIAEHLIEYLQAWRESQLKEVEEK